LALSVGIAFGLVWLFTAISFEIGVLIGAVSLSTILYLFIKISSDADLYFKDDDYIFDKINDEHDLYELIPPRPTQRNRRKKR
jgi:hypothetical protein